MSLPGIAAALSRRGASGRAGACGFGKGNFKSLVVYSATYLGVCEA